jgi:1-acyl-sn-glycerol-3-phosphate acyltransferase
MEAIYLAIAPEGTRNKTDHWKTGFYQIAEKAEIPYVLMIIDYGKKECGFGPVFYPTGDMEADFQKIWDVYRDITPLYPENRSAMQLKRTAAASKDKD